jgi:arsenite-transporting ATPase
MQQKYLSEAHELYDEFFHIVQLPLISGTTTVLFCPTSRDSADNMITEEIRGPQKLKEFSRMLVEPYKPEE